MSNQWGWKRACGESHGRAKLTQSQVGTIRSLRQQGQAKARLARDFKISRRQIDRIVSGEHWLIPQGG